MAIQINFVADVAAQCLLRLQAAGYNFQSSDAEQTIYNYVAVKHRRVATRKRKVHKSNYVVPSHLATGEQQLLAKVAAGDDLWPHQSRQITKENFEDGMLNDYGIQHFHLGTTPDRKHQGLIQGTKEILCAVVKDEDFYALGIFDHTAWTKQELLEIINKTWPELLKSYAIKDGTHMKVLGLRHNYTDEEVKTLRSKNVNALQQRSDGTIHIGMGGGVTSAGTSLQVRRDTDRVVSLTEDLQKAVEARADDYVIKAGLPSDAKLMLTWENDVATIVSDPHGIKIKFPDAFNIPPL